MHILSASRVLPFHGMGGMQAIAWDILLEFARLGHQVTVLTTSIPNRSAAWSEQGVKVVPLSRARAEKYTPAYWHGCREYVRNHVGEAFDAVLGISTGAAGLLPLRNKELKIPFLCQLHGSSWTEMLSKWKSMRILEWAKSARNLYWLFKDATLYPNYDALILVGDVLKREFDSPPLAWMTGSSKKTVILNGIDTAQFCFDPVARADFRSKLSLPNEDKVIVFAARLHPQKGCAEAIRALASLMRSSRRYTLVVAGSGPEEWNLRQLASSLDCDDRVVFTGALERTEVPALLSAGDAFVFPSMRKEGLPMNVLEALSSGLPTICAADMRNVFREALPITYADPHDPDAFAATIEGALSAVQVTRRSLLTPEYSLRQCALSYLKTIGELCVSGPTLPAPVVNR
jgi:glycosyltransferase involved in cell wall biosynthesis